MVKHLGAWHLLVEVWGLAEMFLYEKNQFWYDARTNKQHSWTLLTFTVGIVESVTELISASCQKLLLTGDVLLETVGVGGSTEICGTGLNGSVGLKAGAQPESSRDENCVDGLAFTSVWLLDSVLTLLLLTRHVLWHWRQTARGRSEFNEVDLTVFCNTHKHRVH